MRQPSRCLLPGGNLVADSGERGLLGCIAWSAAVEHVQPERTRAPRHPASTLFNPLVRLRRASTWDPLGAYFTSVFSICRWTKTTAAIFTCVLHESSRTWRVYHGADDRDQTRAEVSVPPPARGSDGRWPPVATTASPITRPRTSSGDAEVSRPGCYALAEGRPVQPAVHPAEAPR